MKLDELFHAIHVKQAQKMLAALDADEVSPQMLGAINRFLADNHVTGIKDTDREVQTLADGLAEYEKSQNVVGFRR